MERFYHLILVKFYLGFLCAGFFCALISGIIEYDVFASLLSQSIVEGASLSGAVPFLIVFSFETTKLFLTFFLQRKKDVHMYGTFNAIKWSLIVISFLCTIVFTIYKLDDAELKNQLNSAKVNPEYSDIERQLQEDEQKENDRYAASNNATVRIIGHSRSEIQRLEKILANEEDMNEWPSAKREIDSHIHKIESLESGRNAEDQRHIDNLARLREHADNQKVNREKAAFERTNEKQKVMASLIGPGERDNRLIRSFLLVTYNINNTGAKEEYPRSYYVLLIVLFSLVMSAGLEFVIHASFTVLGDNPDTFLGIDLTSYREMTRPAIVGMICFVSWSVIHLSLGSDKFNPLGAFFILIIGTIGGFVTNQMKTGRFEVSSKKEIPQLSFDAKFGAWAPSVRSTLTTGIFTTVLAFFAVVLFPSGHSEISSGFTLTAALISGAIGQLGSDTVA